MWLVRGTKAGNLKTALANRGLSFPNLGGLESDGALSLAVRGVLIQAGSVAAIGCDFGLRCLGATRRLRYRIGFPQGLQQDKLSNCDIAIAAIGSRNHMPGRMAGRGDPNGFSRGLDDSVALSRCRPLPIRARPDDGNGRPSRSCEAAAPIPCARGAAKADQEDMRKIRSAEAFFGASHQSLVIPEAEDDTDLAARGKVPPIFPHAGSFALSFRRLTKLKVET